MTRHLINLGHRSIVFIAGPRESYDAQERQQAFLATMKSSRIAVPKENIWNGDFTEAGGFRLMDAFLAKGGKLPDALFASNDAMAVGAYRALRERGMRVPEDVALVGFDNTDLARLLNLTTVHVPMRLIGRESARHALELIDGRTPGRHHVLPTHLEIRGSCGRKI